MFVRLSGCEREKGPARGVAGISVCECVCVCGRSVVVHPWTNWGEEK